MTQIKDIPRAPFTLAALFAAGSIAVFGYSCATRDGAPTNEVLSTPRSESVAADAAPGGANAPAAPPATSLAQVDSEPASTQAAAPDPMVKWRTDATGDDRTARAHAIAALAKAPKAQALPVLHSVLTTGTADDRHLALKSLRTLAEDQGDADGEVRNTIRQAIYHGDEDAIVSDAQAVLDDVERGLKTP